MKIFPRRLRIMGPRCARTQIDPMPFISLSDQDMRQEAVATPVRKFAGRVRIIAPLAY